MTGQGSAFPADLTLATAGTATWRTLLAACLRDTARKLRIWAGRGTAPPLDAALRQLDDRTLLALLHQTQVGTLARALLVEPCPLAAAAQAEVAAALCQWLRHDGQLDAQRRAVLDARHPICAAFPTVALCLRDTNPLPIFDHHPERRGNQVGLADRPLHAWTEMLDLNLRQIDRYLPHLAAELRLGLQAIFPVGFDTEKHQSASYLHAIGAVYLTLHPAPMTMVEALIHEFQHNKLHALLLLDDVMTNGVEARYASPVRPDLRPLRGVLLAVHAFLPVAELYVRMRDAGDELSRGHYFGERLRQVAMLNRSGVETLRNHAVWTAMGGNLWRETEALEARLWLQATRR